ncbi:MAG: ABC transporter substrate-binding protein [Burkholderiales bacterium]|nr:MAG: ABC transporter substrate-binding protein [Burkholderiales bacterium]
MLSSAVAWSAGIAVTDDRGKVQMFDKTPQRIVSVLPSLTESVCALGACARLVGVDRYSNWPMSVTKLPQVGGGLDLNIEAIVRLKPDVVLAATSSRAGERLEALGIRVLMFEPSSHEQVRSSLMQLDALLEANQATALWKKVEEDFVQAAKLLPPLAQGAKVYFEVDRTPYAAGEASFIGQTLSKLGLKNIVGKSLGAFPKINPEFVVQQQPDVIVLSERHAAELPQRPGWKQLKALQSKAVCELTAAEGDVVVRSGPRLAEGAKVLAQCIAKVMKK